MMDQKSEIHYELMKPSETITSDRYRQQILEIINWEVLLHRHTVVNIRLSAFKSFNVISDIRKMNTSFSN